MKDAPAETPHPFNPLPKSVDSGACDAPGCLFVAYPFNPLPKSVDSSFREPYHMATAEMYRRQPGSCGLETAVRQT